MFGCIEYIVYLLVACICDYFTANQETVVELLAFFKQVIPSKSSSAIPVNSNSSSSLLSNTEHAQSTTYQVCILSTNMSSAILHMNELFIKNVSWTWNLRSVSVKNALLPRKQSLQQGSCHCKLFSYVYNLQFCAHTLRENTYPRNLNLWQFF